MQLGTAGPEGAVDPAALSDTRSFDLQPGLPFPGRLYLQTPRSSAPSWRDFVNDGLSPGNALTLLNRHASALLVVRVAKHWFAIPFGFGRHLIREDSIETGFGLRAALNTVDADQLRSVDLKTIEEMTVQTRRQTSRSTGPESFGINVTRDILGGVTGRPRDTALGSVISGRDACSLHSTITFEQLGDKCKQLLDAYSREDYKTRFAWIDHLRTVDDETLINALDDRLAAAFTAKTFERLHLAPPEQLDWDAVSGFRYSAEASASALRSDLDPADYVAVHEARTRGGGALDADRLRKDKVIAFGGPADTKLDAWTVYKCCVFETPYVNELFALSGGVWYRIDPTFATDIAHQIEAIAEFAAADWGFPPATPGEHEEDYLVRAAPLVQATLNTPVVVMDQLLVRAADAATAIEVCDLFTGTKQFVHAKRRARSSTLSHLFAQGTVSAHAFASDQTYREGARAQVAQTPCGTEALFPSIKPIASDYGVVFAIIARGEHALGASLPFLSQVNLSYAARQIAGWGFDVAIVRIDQLP
jgi:uncharacterized protein (TIGR04141 family)